MHRDLLTDQTARRKARIIPRRLTHEEALRLHLELKTTPNILGYTVQELLVKTDVQVAEVGGVFAGASWSVDLLHNWTEIAAVLVCPEFRGEGVGKALFNAAWEQAIQRQRHLYVLSRNPQVVGWMREKGMRIDGTLWCAPLAAQWFMLGHMTSWYRCRESVRKGRMISQCPRLVQGIKRCLNKG